MLEKTSESRNSFRELTLKELEWVGGGQFVGSPGCCQAPYYSTHGALQLPANFKEIIASTF
jgi:hypothetical protein